MFENEINNNMNSSINGGGLTRIYRNSGNNMSIGDNHSTAITNSRPYVKVDKYILNKYIKKNNNNKEPYQYHFRNPLLHWKVSKMWTPIKNCFLKKASIQKEQNLIR